MTAVKGRATVDMTHGSPVRLILRFALPMLAGQLLQQVYVLSDTMITGHFIGDSAIAAIGASAPLHDLMVNFATGMGNGCGILISQLYGAGRMDRLRKATAVMLMICVLLGVGLTLVMVLYMEPLLRLLNTPETVFSQALGGWYDIVVCMYHDQGHIPLKTVGFVYDREKQDWKAVEGVNVTLGLPIIRASVDHGTDFYHAGKGNGNELSLVNAIKYAVKMTGAKN